MVVQSVMIIGAGAGGLAAIKTCLEEGLEPTCFEMKPDIGGLWLLDESFERDAWRRQTLITNTSREMTGFSDFPFPRDAPPFLTGEDVLRYYQKYAERFNLRPYIHCNAEVTKLEQNTDNKKWCVEVSKPGVGTKDYTFDAVLICCGRRQTYIPHYPGLETFKGTVTHSEQYRSNAGIDDKKVLVVGASHSAGDVAVHASNNASQVFMSIREGTWIITRNGPDGWPHDAFIHRRINFLPPEWYLQSWVKRTFFRRINFDTLGLRSVRNIFHSDWMVNDNMQIKIMAGKVKIKPGIDHFTTTGVTLSDGSTLEVDTVIFATGYRIAVPLVDTSIIQENSTDFRLYKSVFPPRLGRDGTLACIGLINIIGSYAPVAELQARWTVRVFKGLCKLPTPECMLKDVMQTRQDELRKRGKCSTVVFQVKYQDEVASLAGLMPNWFKLLFTDPILAYHFLFGPAVPYYFRLEGPHAWPGARDAVIGCWESYTRPTMTRKLEGPKTSRLSVFVKYSLILSIILSFILSLIYY